MDLLQAPLPAHPRCTGVYWRLDQGSSSVTVTRQLAALAQLGQVRPGSSQGELAVQALLLGAAAAERVASKPTAWVQQEGWLQKARQRLAAVPNLNRSQKEAIAFALSRTLTLWQVRRWCRGCVLKLQCQVPWGAAAGHGLQSAFPCQVIVPPTVLFPSSPPPTSRHGSPPSLLPIGPARHRQDAHAAGLHPGAG